MSEPETSIRIKKSDLRRAEIAKQKSEELRAAIELLDGRLSNSEYPSRKEVADLIDKLGKSGASMVAMGSW